MISRSINLVECIVREILSSLTTKITIWTIVWFFLSIVSFLLWQVETSRYSYAHQASVWHSTFRPIEDYVFFKTTIDAHRFKNIVFVDIDRIYPINIQLSNSKVLMIFRKNVSIKSGECKELTDFFVLFFICWIQCRCGVIQFDILSIIYSITDNFWKHPVFYQNYVYENFIKSFFCYKSAKKILGMVWKNTFIAEVLVLCFLYWYFTSHVKMPFYKKKSRSVYSLLFPFLERSNDLL